MGKKKKAVETWLAGIRAGQSSGDLLLFLELKDLLSGTQVLKVSGLCRISAPQLTLVDVCGSRSDAPGGSG